MKGLLFAVNTQFAKTGTRIGLGEGLHFYSSFPTSLNHSSSSALAWKGGFLSLRGRFTSSHASAFGPNGCHTHVSALGHGDKVPGNT